MPGRSSLAYVLSALALVVPQAASAADVPPVPDLPVDAPQLPTDPVAGSAASDADEATLDGINAERTKRGLRPVKLRGAISRTCRSYAGRMIIHNRWAHAGSPRVKGFKGIAEILGREPSGNTANVIDMWLNSPIHRDIMLDGRYRYVGVATKTGRMGGQKTTVYVVRFAR